jgi:hypothetical protein
MRLPASQPELMHVEADVAIVRIGELPAGGVCI